MPRRRPLVMNDPLDGLPPAACGMVHAARRLLADEGFSALTVERVAAAADTYKDAVRYYFGGKAGLVAAVVASLAHDSSLESARLTRSLPSGDEKVSALLAADRKLAADVASSRALLNVLPHALLDDELRRRIAHLYDWYRDLYVGCFEEGLEESQRQRLRLLAGLMVAMIDGLAIQKALDPGTIYLEPLFDLWEELVDVALARLG
ncbi:MAG: TetR/AcrR family transcriptional regulator [Thermoleophilia bacterium]